MTKTIAAVAIAAAASFSFVAGAAAEDFYAAPMNPGPAKVTGLGPVGDLANVALLPVNAVAVPILSPEGAAPAAAVVVHHRRHHRWHHKM